MTTTTTTRDHRHGWACIDCTVLIAYDETAPTAWPWVRRIDERPPGARVTLGRLYGEHGCEHDELTEAHVEHCEQDDYSTAPCDYCGSRLAGGRFAITEWPAASTLDSGPAEQTRSTTTS